MIIDRARNNRPETLCIAGYYVVDHFTYLGSTESNKGGCDDEVTRPIQMGRSAMAKLKKIWQVNSLTFNTNKLIVTTLVFPIML